MSSSLRTLLSQRDDLLARAQKLIDTANAEGRDLTEAERAQFTAIMGKGETAGQLAELDTKIDQVNAEREALRKAGERRLGRPGHAAIKPDQAPVASIKRTDFDELTVDDRAAFIQAGGKVED